MKLTITKADILKLVNEKYNLNLEINELTISNTSKTKIIKGTSQFEVALRAAVKMFPDMSCQKISAIKEFRNTFSETHLGLAEAKYAVENVENAIRQYNNTGKIPYGI